MRDSMNGKGRTGYKKPNNLPAKGTKKPGAATPKSTAAERQAGMKRAAEMKKKISAIGKK